MTTYQLQFSDNAITTLAAGIAPNSPSLQVVSGGGALFPVLGAAQAFICTLVKSGSPTIREVILVTGHASGSDNFTGLARDLDGTGALAWSAGDIVSLRPTAVMFYNFTQLIDAQAQRGNYAIDTGSANAYQVNLSPALNAHVVGMPIRWKAAHNNTGFSTFDDGLGPAQLRTPQLQQLLPGQVIAGGIYESVWDGTFFQLVGTPSVFFSTVLGTILNVQVPFSAVAQWESAFLIAFSQLTGQLLQSQVPSGLNLPGVPTAGTAGIGSSTGQIANCAFVNPGSSFGGANNYRRNPDGSVDQWGLCNPNGGTITVTFPIAFPTACDSVVPGQISSGPTQGFFIPASVSRTGFQIANTGGPSYWQAKGH